MTWQPIETAPKDGTRVLLFIEGVVTEGTWDRSWLSWHTPSFFSQERDPDYEDCAEPTHWMPRPANPGEQFINP